MEKTMYRFSKRSRRNMIGLHPYMAFFLEKMMEQTKQDFGILNKGGIRTDQDQRDMFAQGRTTEGKKVTWTLDSYHQYGLAGDTVAFHNGKPTWKVKHYAYLIELGHEIVEEFDLPIEHAFDVGLKSDYPHWQMTGYKSYFDHRKYIL